MKLFTRLFILICFLSTSVIFSTPTFSQNMKYIKSNQLQQDGVILAWLIVLDKNEINAAKLVLKKPIDPVVQKFAHLMIKDHSKNLEEVMAASHKIGENPIKLNDAIDLQEHGRNLLTELKPLNDQELQMTYINAMVKGHTEALEKIDQDYLKVVVNPRLKQLLKTSREHIKFHLEKAKQIQAKLNT